VPVLEHFDDRKGLIRPPASSQGRIGGVPHLTAGLIVGTNRLLDDRATRAMELCVARAKVPTQAPLDVGRQIHDQAVSREPEEAAMEGFVRVVAVWRFVVRRHGHGMFDGLHHLGMRTVEANPARVVVIAGVVLKANDPPDLAQETCLVDGLCHAVEGKAEKVLAHAQHNLVAARRLDHLPGLRQEAGHAGLHLIVNAILRQVARDRVV